MFDYFCWWHILGAEAAMEVSAFLPIE